MQDIPNNQSSIENNHEKISFWANHKRQDQTSKTFVLINCTDNGVNDTIAKIKKMDSASQVQKTDGSYDIVVTLDADTDHEVKEALRQIRASDTISHTVILRSSPDTEVLW